MKMKHITSLALFVLAMIICSNCIQIEASKPKDSKKKTKKKRAPLKPFLQGYFFIQRLYPGLSPFDNLSYSSTTAMLKYFTLNKKSLYYSDSRRSRRRRRGGIKIRRILDKRSDIPSQGKCCSNIKYMNYVQKSVINPKTSPIFKKKPNTSRRELNYQNANYCLDIFAPFRARWRLCSLRPIDVYRLHLKMVFILIKRTIKMKNMNSTKIIDRFLTNSKLAPEPVLSWNWETQTKWENKCRSKLMQSPIEIKESTANTDQIPNFKISYLLLNTNVEIVRRFNEIVINFTNDPGLVMIEINNKRVTYQPKYISFRFPGEHVIIGKRYIGEMLINCEELEFDKKKRTKGLIITVPLEAKSEYTNYEPLENLSIDFWKFMVLKKGKYTPKNFLTKKKLVFKLKQVIHSVTEGKPLFYFYLGSQTTPPCEEFAYHLVVGKPLKIANCQMKVLRENSLATTETKQVHSRLLQINNPDEYDDKDEDGKDGEDGEGDSDGSDGSDGGDKGDGSDGDADGTGGKANDVDLDGLGGYTGRGSGGVYALRSITYDPSLYRYVPKVLRTLNPNAILKGDDQFVDGTDTDDPDGNSLNC